MAAAPSKQVNVSKASAGADGRVCCGITWQGVPLELATWEGACFDRACALAWRLASVLPLAVFSFAAPRRQAEGLPEALVKAYQSNPQLNAERARQRATDENVPQALAGYRPQIIASLSGGLQAVRNLLPDNTVQSARP